MEPGGGLCAAAAAAAAAAAVTAALPASPLPEAPPLCLPPCFPPPPQVRQLLHARGDDHPHPVSTAGSRWLGPRRRAWPGAGRPSQQSGARSPRPPPPAGSPPRPPARSHRSEFQTPDEEMKKIVLKVVKQCVGTEGVEPEYIRTEVGWLAAGREVGAGWGRCRGGGGGRACLPPAAAALCNRSRRPIPCTPLTRPPPLACPPPPDPARVLQALLGAAHGAGPPQLPRPGGDHGGDCQQGGRLVRFRVRAAGRCAGGYWPRAERG